MDNGTMTDEEKKLDLCAKKKALMVKLIVLRMEIIIGVLASISGLLLTVLIWGEGYYPGAIMLIMTGAINVFLAFKEMHDPSDGVFHWQAIFFMIVRRAMFFLNVVLLALVLGTFTNLL